MEKVGKHWRWPSPKEDKNLYRSEDVLQLIIQPDGSRGQSIFKDV